MNNIEDAAKVLAEHQRITSEPGGPCWCGDWPHDEVRRDTWMDHVSTALADAGLLRPDGDTDHAACHEHADVIADQRNAVIRHGRVPVPDDEHTSDGRCKYPTTCAGLRPDGDTPVDKVLALHVRLDNPRHGCCAPPKLCHGHRPVCNSPDHGINRPDWPCATVRAIAPWVEVPS